MRISLAPQRRDETLALERSGDTLVINGEAFDFSYLPEGGTLPHGAVASDFVFGAVSRVGGAVTLTLILPHGPNPSGAVAFPDPIVEPGDGPIELPVDPITLAAEEEAVDEQH